MNSFCKMGRARKAASLLKRGLISAMMWGVGMGVTNCSFADEPPPVPDLTQGGKKDDRHDWNLGPTGARGWMFGWELSTSKARQILITKVEKGSPADGVLKEGDVIVGLQDHLFQRDARIALGTAITNGERRGQLQLNRWRNGKTETVVLKLKAMGEYTDSSPFDCPKSALIADRAYETLSKRDLNNDFIGKINALGLLATGRPEVLPKLKKFAHEIGRSDLKLKRITSIDMSTWDLGFSNLFLTEYFLATHDDYVLPAIKEYSRMLADGQTPVGLWGHGMANRGTLGGYGAINQAALGCWMSLVLAQKCGVNDPPVAEAVERSSHFYSFFVNKGSLPYGDHAPAFYVHDNNGKNAQAAIIFDILGNKPATQFYSRTTTAAYAEREMGHTGNFFSYMWGPLGAARSGNEAVAAHLKEQRWFYDLARRWDGSFLYQGGAGDDDSYNGDDMTGSFLLTYSLPKQHLYCTGKGIKPANVLTGKELQTVIDSGRYFDPSTIRDTYDIKKSDELLENLGSWSPTVRDRAAIAIGKKPLKVVPELIAMLEDKNIYRVYGACQALERLGPASAPAVDALIAQLAKPDQWLQIRASATLAAIGAPARKAIPDMLKIVLAGTPNEPRETVRRYVGQALFAGEGIDDMPPHGLLVDSIDGVDRNLLIPSIKKLLAIDDGLMRGQIRTMFSKLSEKELDGLWPDILRATNKYAPTGEMWADEIRLAGLKLLAEHHIKEGLRVGVNYAKHQNPWGSQDRMGEIMNSLALYGTNAHEFLPELRELVETCRKEDFPDDAKRVKIANLIAGIKKIEAAKETPQLRSVAPAGKGK